MNFTSHEALTEVAQRVREHIVRMSGRGGCFIGASLSCTDLLVHLYGRVLNIDPARLDDPDRDIVLLSKGHDVPALYGTLAEFGILDPMLLEGHLTAGSGIYWHPSTDIPGVEFHSGSLGHLLAVGVGMAIDQHLADRPGRTFVVVGDGELNEGSNWEAMLVAAARRLHRLVVIVDRNGIQANRPTESLVPLEPLADKFEAFGWRAIRVDGHDFTQLDEAYARLDPTMPTVVIADTIRGKGIPSIEHRPERWFMRCGPAEVDDLLSELHGAAPHRRMSEPLVVR